MYRLFTLFTLLTLVVTATAWDKAAAKNPPVIRNGSKGPETSDLQFRLHTLGYLKVAPTGRFGTLTEKALQRFQKAHGLRADGIAGMRTWKKLKRTSLSKKDLTLLARIIHAEARGETYKGQVAVGAVVLNRLRSPEFPKTVKAVMMEKNQFSCIQDGQIRLTPNATAFRAAKAAVKGWDPTGNALFYYNPNISDSKWFKKLRTRATAKIGNHQFYA
jgi:peptidoglycan lytic transglycosylase